MAHVERRAESDAPALPGPFRWVVEENRGVWADLAPPDVSMVDELIAERRREAAMEDED